MILVLPAEATDAELDQVRAACRRLGWEAEVSRGREQVVLALEGHGTREELERALAAREVDVIAIESARAYRIRHLRRRLLSGLAVGLGLVAAVGWLIPVVGFLRPARGALVDHDVVRAGSVESFSVGGARPVLVRGVPVLVIGLEPDRHVALSGLCTHLEVCKLEWDPARSQLVCPCHGCTFDTHGNVLRGPASRPLLTYAVERTGAELFVRRL